MRGCGSVTEPLQSVGHSKVTSSSEDEEANIRIEFNLGRDIDSAANDVRDRVSRVVDQLPPEAEMPEVQKADSSVQSVMWLTLTSDSMNQLDLTDYAERVLVDQLSVVDGVARVRVGGQRRYAMRVWLDPEKIATLGMTPGDVVKAIQEQNVQVSGGVLGQQPAPTDAAFRAFRAPVAAFLRPAISQLLPGVDIHETVYIVHLYCVPRTLIHAPPVWNRRQQLHSSPLQRNTIMSIATITRSSRIAQVVVATAVAGSLLSALPRPTSAQAIAPRTNTWELRLTSGAFVPTGEQNAALTTAQVSAAQLSWLVRPSLAVTGTFVWARSKDRITTNSPRLDVFSSDIGIESRFAQRPLKGGMSFTPFIGVGGGARSYNYRKLDVDATNNLSGYGAIGGELGIYRVGVRLEVRDYATGFKPLVGAGRSEVRNDVVFLTTLRFNRKASSGKAAPSSAVRHRDSLLPRTHRSSLRSMVCTSPGWPVAKQ